MRQIDGKSLVDRWHVEPVDLLYIMVNNMLFAVDQYADSLGMEDILRYYKEDDSFDTLSLMFRLSDINALETKLKSEGKFQLIDTIRGKDLMARWGMYETEIHSLMFNKGLGAIDPFGEPIDPLLYMDGHIFRISDLLFSLSEIEEFESNIPELLNHVHVEDKIEIKSIETDHSLSDEENVFLRLGENWEIKYMGEKTISRDLERLRYIIHLLEKPHIEFRVTELVSLVKGQNSLIEEEKRFRLYSQSNDNEDDEDTLYQSLQTDKLYYEDIAPLEESARSFWDELNYAKRSSVAKDIEEAENKWNKCIKLLSNEYGIITSSKKDGTLFFKYKIKATDDVEKARTNVTKNIKNAIKSFENKLPELFEHLSRYITTGVKCSYNPDRQHNIIWHINWNN